MPEVEPKVEKQNNIQTVQPTQPVRSEPVPQPARPAPAQTAPQQPAPQPEPRPADATSGDTTRTSIIKAFLGRMVPEADSKFLEEGKKDFTHFFGTSVAVVPDDMKSEQERQQTQQRKAQHHGRVEADDKFFQGRFPLFKWSWVDYNGYILD